MKNNLRIIFFGTPDFAMPVLEALVKNDYNVSRFQSKSLKDEQVFEEFKNLKPDICVVAAYGKILPSRYLEIPKYGFLNVHPSILPKYRGPSPIQTAILNGDKETGVSIMLVDAEIDHGPILNEVKYKISNNKNLLEISHELFKLGADLLVKTLPEYISDNLKLKEQDHSQATFTKIFERSDSRLDWNESCEKNYNKIRALNPEPGTWTMWNGKILNILQVISTKRGGPRKVVNIPTCDVGYPQAEDLATKVPGTVRKIGGDIVIRTGTGYLILKSIQLEGGKVMDAKSFVNGHPQFLGSTLE